jgi:succinate dehydrogenase hydrophobic anchor subunit
MLSLIKNLTSSAASFLSSGSAPTGISQTHKDYERLKSLNHMESPKFFVCIVSAAILSFFYFISVAIIFFLPETVPGVATAFVTMFSKTTEILAVIIASYVGAQAVVDLKYNSSSNASIENKTETITQEITVIHTNQKDDDYELD